MIEKEYLLVLDLARLKAAGQVLRTCEPRKAIQTALRYLDLEVERLGKLIRLDG